MSDARCQMPDAVSLVSLANAYAVVPYEVVGSLRRTVSDQIGWCGADQPSVGGDQSGDHPRMRWFAKSNANIEGVVC